MVEQKQTRAALHECSMLRIALKKLRAVNIYEYTTRVIHKFVWLITFYLNKLSFLHHFFFLFVKKEVFFGSVQW